MAPAAEAPPAVTPDFTARQGYLDAAPGGIDARYAWTVSGGRGSGVRIIDVEGQWRFDHEDLLQNQGGMVGGQSANDLDWRNHGTAVIGEFGGDANSIGVTGICAEANVRAISIFGPNWGSSAAIRQAASMLNAGDIILIELHRPGPRFNFAQRDDQRGYIAVEWWEDDFAAIRFAIGRGVIVVEAGGNGAENLDDALYSTRPANFPSTWTNPFNRANRDSGAIVVGAGAPPPGTHGRNHGPDRSRLDFSNWGALIDAQGWGREVTTCGYGDLQGGANENTWYTDQFSGTSSASPIVVAAVGSLQGVARARGIVLTPAQARAHLRATGSAQQDAPNRPASQRIGNRPNLRQLIARVKGKELQKEVIKEFNKEKAEIKREKVEKLEKSEAKERKEAKREKLEKLEAKELKERKNEKLERKELKDIKEGPKEGVKELKEKELEKIKPEVEGLDIKRLGENVGGFDVIRPPGGEGYAASLEQRLAALEGAVSQLTHFISGELRPDLGTGALAGEDDYRDWTQQLGAEDAEAKASKDAKDIEKLSEY
jgi:hypothetical protein